MLVGGVCFASRSQVRASAGIRMFPLIASQIFMILVVDWIHLYHGPQLGLIKVGMWNLLISILVECFFVFVVFYEQKGLISVDTECLKSINHLECCLACRTKGLTLADARCPSLNGYEVQFLV